MFAPFHSFGGCKGFQRQFARLKSTGAIAAPITSQHDLYHYSLLHKLRSAKYHVETLKSYLETQDPSRTPAADIVYRVNFHFDGFLHVLGSAADIFAHEVLVYFGIPFPLNVYFQTAEQMIIAQRPTDPILPLIATPAWRPEFSLYRNTATHESLIGTQFVIRVEVRGTRQTQRVEFPVPDDPRLTPRTFRRNPDIVEYCRLTYRRWLTLFNVAYQHMSARMKTSNTLPL
jgi:hypothetical protein